MATTSNKTNTIKTPFLGENFDYNTETRKRSPKRQEGLAKVIHNKIKNSVFHGIILIPVTEVSNSSISTDV